MGLGLTGLTSRMRLLRGLVGLICVSAFSAQSIFGFGKGDDVITYDTIADDTELDTQDMSQIEEALEDLTSQFQTQAPREKDGRPG